MMLSRVIERKVIKGNEDGLNEIYDSNSEATARLNELKEQIVKEKKIHDNYSVRFSRAMVFKITKIYKYSYLIDYTVVENTFTEDTLKEALGEEKMQQLESVTVDPGKEFMAGNSTHTATVTDKDPDEKAVITPSQLSNNNVPVEFQDSTIQAKQQEALKKTSVDVSSSISAALGPIQPLDLSTSTEKMTLSQKLNATKKMTGQVTNMAAAGFGAYATGRAIVENFDVAEIITTLSSIIVSKTTEIITRGITKITTDYINKHTNAIMMFPQKITAYSMAYFNAYKMSPEEALKALMESNEERKKKKNDESNKKNKDEFVKKKFNNAQEFVNKVQGYVQTGMSYIQMVTSYIQNGPDWVTEQLDKQINRMFDEVNGRIDEQWAKDEKQYNEKAKAFGDKIGQELVGRFNKQLEEAQKESVEKIKKTKTKILIKAFSAKAKLASKLGSQLGVYVPV